MIRRRLKKFANPGIFFSAANVCNFSQGADPIATGIAVGNLAYAILLISLSPGVIAGRLSNSLRVTSYCVLAAGAFLLVAASGGSAAALFPGLAAVFFGIGNFIQSSQGFIKNFRNDEDTNAFLKAALHPAVWYGLGYAMTGINIGGGLALLASSKTAISLTLIGIVETASALGFMASGMVTNMAAPFVGVAAGTLVFAATGLLTGNFLGAATGLFACAGELSLAIMEQQRHNAASQNKPATKVENFFTWPVRAAMDRGWVARMAKVM